MSISGGKKLQNSGSGADGLGNWIVGAAAWRAGAEGRATAPGAAMAEGMEKKFRERVHWAHAARRKKLSWERHVQEREERERKDGGRLFCTKPRHTDDVALGMCAFYTRVSDLMQGQSHPTQGQHARNITFQAFKDSIIN